LYNTIVFPYQNQITTNTSILSHETYFLNYTRTVCAEVFDQAGNNNTACDEIILDLEDPKPVAYVTPYFHNANFTVFFNATDLISGISSCTPQFLNCTLFGGLPFCPPVDTGYVDWNLASCTPGSGNELYCNFGDDPDEVLMTNFGQYRFKYVCTDNAGNVGESSESYAFYDNLTPSFVNELAYCTVTGLGNPFRFPVVDQNKTYGVWPTQLILPGSGIKKVLCCESAGNSCNALAGVPATPTGGNWYEFAFTAGANHVNCTAVDNAGNMKSCDATVV
ncbi:hypothetical protein D6817_02760, partial [Candidatus Pacearchaeota archaeon]